MLVKITNRYFKTASNHMIVKVTKFLYSVVESGTEKRRGNKTINIMACNQDTKRVLRISVHGCSMF